eukprot:m.348644 g.348644  ORF g.348644 m.348644 type:complete len:424 (+) comp20679_c0_seq2:298-1569(+)
MPLRQQLESLPPATSAAAHSMDAPHMHVASQKVASIGARVHLGEDSSRKSNVGIDGEVASRGRLGPHGDILTRRRSRRANSERPHRQNLREDQCGAEVEVEHLGRRSCRAGERGTRRCGVLGKVVVFDPRANHRGIQAGRRGGKHGGTRPRSGVVYGTARGCAAVGVVPATTAIGHRAPLVQVTLPLLGMVAARLRTGRGVGICPRLARFDQTVALLAVEVERKCRRVARGRLVAMETVSSGRRPPGRTRLVPDGPAVEKIVRDFQPRSDLVARKDQPMLHFPGTRVPAALKTVGPNVLGEASTLQYAPSAIHIAAVEPIPTLCDMECHCIDGILEVQRFVVRKPDVCARDVVGGTVYFHAHPRREHNRVEDIVVVAVDLDGCRVGNNIELDIVKVEVRLPQPAPIHHHLMSTINLDAKIGEI